MARRPQATFLALRATVRLTRLGQRRGKRAAARALLAPIEGWCTQGCDTADLQDAQALVEALGKARSTRRGRTDTEDGHPSC